ncbi:hypothetical protein DPMN_191513 [Dreissena polymorpha]|uniref:Uncharacterized protein n=1 Tax=Dreissena polymorpha TaxID=45954 RepID=A0A9D4B6G0_DREPO|nr:hypothetical protein DPMN_191513 [Dreissena polymorpha]
MYRDPDPVCSEPEHLKGRNIWNVTQADLSCDTHANDTNECATAPCKNGATCTNLQNTYSCTCSPGWQGNNCDQDINECVPAPCKNGATCNNLQNAYSCTCSPGWQGNNCDQDTNECATAPCKNGATCTNLQNTYSCTCSPGWQGNNCDQDINECVPAPCKNGATCNNLQNAYSCTCSPGWQGNNCDQDTNECATAPCKNGATCTNLQNTYSCTCSPGWQGNNCDQDINECAPAPCKNGATCNNLQNAYSCTCPPGWQGNNCDQDCGFPPDIPNGIITLFDESNTTYGALAKVNCTPGYEHTQHIIQCATSGWENTSCEPHDCGPTPSVQNGFVQTSDGTTFGKTAVYACIPGYTFIGFPVVSCLSSGWPLIENLCVIKDCGQLKNPTKGKVDMSKGSTYQAVARYTCNRGYDLIGDEKRMCQSTGTWSGIQPSCISEEQTKVVCKTNVDIRGTEWKEVIQGSTRVQQCAEGFEGNITRVCLNDGTWQLSQYNCVRKTVTDVSEKVEKFVSNATADMVSNALEQIVNVTGYEDTTNTLALLTDAEITVLANSLAKVAEIVVNKSLPTEHVVKAYVQSVSNLVDERNKQSWETIKQHNSYGGENMSVDKIGVALREKVASGEEGFTNITIVQKNVALEVKKVNKQDIVFPYADITIDQHQDQIWAKTSDSSIRLKAKAIGDTEVIVTVVIFKDMSHVLPNTSETPIGVKTKDQQINGPILSLSLSNHFGKLNPPVLLTFGRMKANLTSPVCSYWTFGRKKRNGLLGQ